MRSAYSRQYAIIGSGVAGFQAVQTIRAVNPNSEITLISDDPAGYYSRPGLAYLLTGEISEDHLFPFKKKDIAQLHLNFQIQQAVKIDPREHRIRMANDEEISYSRLLIATGSLAAPLKDSGQRCQRRFQAG